MVKIPTKHGLDKKYKPWRKGKSEKSNKRSSLKQQLRGFKRLLAKLDNESTDGGKDVDKDSTVDQRRVDLRAKIETLQQEIDGKQHQIMCKKHAEKAHGLRFMDRQKLTRLEKQVRRRSTSGISTKGGVDPTGSSSNDPMQQDDQEKSLFKIALDQVYVAHHPTDVKYTPLFKKGQRVVDQSRQLYRRAVTRKRILKGLAAANPPDSSVPAVADRWERVQWISSEQYKLLPSDWTIQDEERVFGGSISRSNKDSDTKQNKGVSEGKARSDNRFAMGSTHEAMMKAVEQYEAEFDQEEMSQEGDNHDVKQQEASKSRSEQKDRTIGDEHQGIKEKKGDDDSASSSTEDSSDSDSDSNDDEVDPLHRNQSIQPKVSNKTKEQPQSKSDDIANKDGEDDDSSSSSSESSSDSDSDSDSDSSSSDSSDDDDLEQGKESNERVQSTEDADKPPINDESDDSSSDDDVDDFLMDADDDDGKDNAQNPTNVFQRSTTAQIPAWGEARGDKSRGWETQRQRPGEFKRKRTRR